MPVFAYTGVDAERRTVRGTITADSPRAAREDLRSSGVRVRGIENAGGAVARDATPAAGQSHWQSIRNQKLRWGRRSRRAAWVTAMDELSMMLGAGLPILESLETIADQHRGSFRAAVLSVREAVAGGASLTGALGTQGNAFDAASLQMVTVGENSGSLDTVLARWAAFERKRLTTRDRVTTALVYPAFLVVFGSAAAVFLMTWVLPPLLENLEDTVDTLPWPTRVARAMSNVLLDHSLAVIVVAVTAVGGGFWFWSSERGRRWWHRWLLRLPLIGPMSVKQAVSRIAGVIATLSSSGVELTRAFELARDSIDNTVFQDALVDCTTKISAGSEVADAMQSTGVFPPLAVRVFSVGQESGKLDSMLWRLSEDYDRQVATTSARLTALVEPVLILGLAVAVGFLLLATILPILEAGNVVGQ